MPLVCHGCGTVRNEETLLGKQLGPFAGETSWGLSERESQPRENVAGYLI